MHINNAFKITLFVQIASQFLYIPKSVTINHFFPFLSATPFSVTPNDAHHNTRLSSKSTSLFNPTEKRYRNSASKLIGATQLSSIEDLKNLLTHFFITMESFVETITKQHIWESEEWKALKEAVPGIQELHLRQLLQVLSTLFLLYYRMRSVLSSSLWKMMALSWTTLARSSLLRSSPYFSSWQKRHNSRRKWWGFRLCCDL